MNALKHITALLACFMMCMAGHAVQIRKEPGRYITESLQHTDRDNPVLWTESQPSLLTRAVAPGGYAVKDIPRTGTIEYPLILVDFIDRQFTIRDTLALLERYDRMFNEQGYTDTAVYVRQGITYYGANGSVSDYFRDQSYGKYTPKFVIIGPVHPSKSYSFYGKGKDTNVDLLVHEICDSIHTKGLANLSGFARNGNMDQLSIIFAGRGENYQGSDPNTIWPQADTIWYERNGVGNIKFVCTCELFWDSDSILDGIGTFCHEFSHTLGLPDFYNTVSDNDSKNNAAMGYWSIMDYGNYEDGGFSPVGYTAFEKYSLGWMDLEEITYAGTYVLNDISCAPNPDEEIHTAYRLNTGYDDQFIILENHMKTGWYKYHASQGLMVTSVNYNNNNWVNNTVNNSLKCYRILPADNKYDRESNAGDLFPYLGIDSVTTLGTPILKAGGSYPSLSIYGISIIDSLVSFRASPDMPTKAAAHPDMEISIDMIQGELSVSAPTGSRITVYDISGKKVVETATTQPQQQISLPGKGIWIVKCGDITRKVRN